MIPRFSNPHYLQQSTQLVSRADLEAEHDVPHLDVEEEYEDDAVSTLENILKRSLGDYNASHSTDVASEDSERQKKRRKKDNNVVPEGTSGIEQRNAPEDEPVGMSIIILHY